MPCAVRILVIEDNDPRFEVLENLFAHPRVRVVRAATGGAALRMVRSDSHMLILLDHDLEERLPAGMTGKAVSGFDVARVLAEGGPNRSTPVRIHSMNTSCRQEMLEFLRVNQLDAEIVPMDTWTQAIASEWIADLLDAAGE